MYVDTSVLVKLYVQEPDSDACEVVAEGTPLVSSRLLYCEFRSAIIGKVSRGSVSHELGAAVWQEFERDIETRHIQFVPISDTLVRDAADLLAELHPNVQLRTLDALHLATFLSADVGPLFTKDARMLRAAAQLGLSLAG
jgi:uncharacterized protein